MLNISAEEFEILVGEAMDAQPVKYMEKLQNVVFVTEDLPTDEQREKLKLNCHQTLFGLYEGIPQTRRGGNYAGVVPDKITIFRLPILNAAFDIDDLKSRLKHTVWHEMAHHFGLQHDQIHKLDGTGW